MAAGDMGQRVKAGETYTVDVPAPTPAAPQAQAIPLAVVYEDAHLIVIDKPKGLAVHPGPGHTTGTLVNALIAHCGASLSGIGGVKRPGIVHRLDKDTTGLLVVAKTDKAHAGLARQFAAHGADGQLERRYLALVWGALDRPRGGIDAALARSSANRTKIAVVTRGCGPARRHPLRGARDLRRKRRRSPLPACSSSRSRPGGRTRSACTSPISATRCSAT